MSAAEILLLSRTKAEVLYHGLSSHYFDRTNNLALWSIVEMFIEGCLLPQRSHVFADNGELFRDTNNMLFTVQMSCYLSQEIQLVKRLGKYKILASSTMSEVGTTSYVLKVILSNYTTKKWLGEFYIKFVHINGNSRRRQPLPDWFVRGFANTMENHGRLPTLQTIPDIPKDAYSTTVLTRFSDLDNNQHVTTREYLNFFNDCATEAAFAKYYTHFEHDMSWYPVMGFDVTMLGESKAGEILTVSTWQDRSNVTHVFFACFKDGKCVVKAVFVYNLTRKEAQLPYKL